jgi:transposase InsO family protein
VTIALSARLGHAAKPKVLRATDKASGAINKAGARCGHVAVESIGEPTAIPRGSEFRSRKFVRALHRYCMVGSMSKVGAAGDNAVMESFFALLHNNALDRGTWGTREQLRSAIVTWIERT